MCLVRVCVKTLRIFSVIATVYHSIRASIFQCSLIRGSNALSLHLPPIHQQQSMFFTFCSIFLFHSFFHSLLMLLFFFSVRQLKFLSVYTILYTFDCFFSRLFFSLQFVHIFFIHCGNSFRAKLFIPSVGAVNFVFCFVLLLYKRSMWQGQDTRTHTHTRTQNQQTNCIAQYSAHNMFLYL